MITEPELRDVLARQAQSYDVPPHDLMRLRAAALRRQRDTRLRYGAAAAALLLAGGVAWGQLRAEEVAVDPADRGSDVTISPSCFPAGEAPPVPDSPWAGAGFVSDKLVSATSVDSRSCELVLHYAFHRFGPGAFISGSVWLYSDGRLIVDTDADGFVQWEQRLSPAGTERLRRTVEDMLGEPVTKLRRDSGSEIHRGDGTYYPDDPGALKELLLDRSWLSDEDWVTESPSLYRAEWYLTCYGVGGPDGDDVRAAVRDLPTAAEVVLESRTWTTVTPGPGQEDVPSRCVVLSRADAAVLVEVLGGDFTEGMANVFPWGRDGPAAQFSVHALMPDGTSGAHGD